MLTLAASAQCSIPSSNGYVVSLTMAINSVVPSSTVCTNGYNYNLAMSYTINYSGSNIPVSLYTLQVTAQCGTDNNSYFGLPLAGTNSTGTFTTGSNVWRQVSDCNTSTPITLNCNNLLITIHGPGIPHQVINCTPIIGLPIELTEMSCYHENNYNIVKWKTLTESNNKEFYILKSTDAVHWNKIVTVSGAGNSDHEINYTFKDDFPARGLNYYRLVQVDYDGSYTEYNIIYCEVPEEPNYSITYFTLLGQPVDPIAATYGSYVREMHNNGNVKREIVVK